MENSKSKTIFSKSGRLRDVVVYERVPTIKGLDWKNLGVLDIKKWWLGGGGRTWRLDCIHFGKCHSQQESKHSAKIITVVV